MPNSSTLYLELDKTGQSINNLVQWEQHTLPNTATKLVIPLYGAFYSESVQLYWMDTANNQNVLLTKGVDYYPTEMLHKVTTNVGKEVCTVLLLVNIGSKQHFLITYQALGGSNQINRDNLFNLMYQIENPSTPIEYKDILNKPKAFQPGPHLHDALDLYGLEYIRDGISKLDTAILTGDLLVNQSLIEYTQNNGADLIEIDVNRIPAAVDTTMTLVKSAEDTLKIVYDNILKITPMIEKLITDNQTFNSAVMDYKADSFNDKLANVANLLCKRNYATQGLVVNVPNQIEGNVVYLVSDNYNPTTRVWVDQTASGTWTADTATAPAYGACSTNPSINSLKFTTGKFLTRQTGSPVSLSKNKTIITVTAPIISTDYVKLSLFSDNAKKTSIDTANSIGFKYSTVNESNTYYEGRVSNAIGNKAVVTVAAVGSRQEDCYILSNSPYKRDIAKNGIMLDNLDLDGLDSTALTIGRSTGEQSAEVLMVLVYDRLLSRTEIHAILTYIRLKYNTNVSFIENGDFTNWDEGYGSDLINTIDFTNRNCAAVTDRNIVLWDAQNTYTQPGIVNPNNIKIDNHPYLLVLSNDANKAFWRETVDLDVYCRYELKFSVVYGQINPPVIRMRINGLGISSIVSLPSDQSIVRDYVISFTPTTKVNKVELFNLNESTTGNCFGIGAISVVRKIYAD